MHIPEGADVADRRDQPRRALDLPRAGPARLLPDPRPEAPRQGREGATAATSRRRSSTLAPFGVEATRIDGLTGVWVASPPRKIASIGVHISRWVTTHGYALNVDLDPAPFTDWITACGLEDATFTSLARELGRPVTVDEVRPVARRGVRRGVRPRLRRAAGRRAGPLGAAAARTTRRALGRRRATGELFSRIPAPTPEDAEERGRRADVDNSAGASTRRSTAATLARDAGALWITKLRFLPFGREPQTA